MKVKSYSSIRNVNNPWIPLVPSHWCVSPLKRYLISNDGGVWGSDPEDNEFTYVLRSTDQTVDGYWSIELPAQRYLTAKDRQSATLKEGDLVVTKSSGSSKHIGKTTIVSSDMEKVGYCYGNFMQRLRTSTQLCSKYSWYVMNSFICRQQLDVLSNTTTGLANLNGSLIGELVLPCPSKIEQQKIAQFLDYETAKIDALIDEQKRLIELLKEKRQAVISHAVTKGLNPDAPMKDSGVEWLGDVPEHWLIAQFKYFTTELQTGPFGSQLHSEDYVSDGIPMINPAHIKNGMLTPDKEVSVDKSTQLRLSRHCLQSENMIFARRGELGRCAVVRPNNEGWLCGTGSLKAVLNSTLIPDYAYLLFSSDEVADELGLESKGSTMPNLNTETLGRCRLPIPPVNEQEAIIIRVKLISGSFEQLITEGKKAESLLKERRSALISAAVTGKIDVRDWQPPEDADLIDSNAAVQMERQDG